MTEKITIDLPLPSKELFANSTLAARYKSAARAKARADAKRVAEDLMRRRKMAPPLWSCVTVHCHFRWPNKRSKQDADNASFSAKAYVDGLKRYIAHQKTIKRTGITIPAIEGAGVLANDDYIMDWRITWEINKANPGVTITIVPLGKECAA